MQTSNSKFKRIALIVLTALLVLAGVLVFRYALTAATVTDAVNYHMEQLEKENANVDMFFVGGSRTYRSFDPTIFEKELGFKNVVNYGTPSQRPKLSYYMAKELLKTNKPKAIVIGSTFNGMMYKQDPHSFLFAQNRMTFPSQVECAIDHFGINTGILSLTGKSEYLKNLKVEKIKSNIADKKFFRSGGKEKEIGNGHVGSDDELKNGNIVYGHLDKYEEAANQDEAEKYFDKLVDLCIDSGAKVYLVTGPCSMTNIYRITNYQESVDYYKNIAKEKGIKYFNMNYVKDRENVLTDQEFMDLVHVNGRGGEITSKILAEVISKDIKGESTDSYFYKDANELKKTVKRVVSITTEEIYDNNSLRIVVGSLQNDNIKPIFRVLASTQSVDEAYKEYDTLASWTTKSTFKFTLKSLKKYKTIRVEARTKDGYPGEITAYKLIKIKEKSNEETNGNN